jgi:TetR/AcrR family transcriptional regulator, transcriptional repressor for nem operon
MEQAIHPTRKKILDAALQVIRSKGYANTSVDDLCAAAGLTKGGFFHHFKGKEDLAISAAKYFSDGADQLFSGAAFNKIEDPLLRLLGYIDFRISIIDGALPEYTCFLGTTVQETYQTYPALREACHTYIWSHAENLAKDIAKAKEFYQPDANWSATGLALHTQAVIQGSFILAKASNGPDIAIESLKHLRRYIELLFEISVLETLP